jgi:hypothetical protein
MTFISGLIVGLFVGCALGVLVMCILSLASGGEE